MIVVVNVVAAFVAFAAASSYDPLVGTSCELVHNISE